MNQTTSPSRHGTRFYTSTTRTEFRPSTADSLRRPSSAASSTNAIGRCGPGRDLPNHYLSTQRQSFSRPQSASFITTVQQQQRPLSASTSAGISTARSSQRPCVDPRTAWQQSQSRGASTSRPMSASVTFGSSYRNNSSNLNQSSSLTSGTNTECYKQSHHAAHIYMSTGPWTLKLRQ